MHLDLKDIEEELILGRVYGVVKPWRFMSARLFWGRFRKVTVGGGVGVIFAQVRGGCKGCSAMRPEP